MTGKQLRDVSGSEAIAPNRQVWSETVRAADDGHEFILHRLQDAREHRLDCAWHVSAALDSLRDRQRRRAAPLRLHAAAELNEALRLAWPIVLGLFDNIDRRNLAYLGLKAVEDTIEDWRIGWAAGGDAGRVEDARYMRMLQNDCHNLSLLQELVGF